MFADRLPVTRSTALLIGVILYRESIKFPRRHEPIVPLAAPVSVIVGAAANRRRQSAGISVRRRAPMLLPRRRPGRPRTAQRAAYGGMVNMRNCTLIGAEVTLQTQSGASVSIGNLGVALGLNRQSYSRLCRVHRERDVDRLGQAYAGTSRYGLDT